MRFRERYLWASSATVALSLLVLVAYNYQHGVRTLLEQHRSYQLQALGRAAGELRDFIEQAMEDLLYLSRFPEVRGLDLQQAQLSLEDYLPLARARGVQEIFLTDEKGGMLLHTASRPLSDLDRQSPEGLSEIDLDWATRPASMGTVRIRALAGSQNGLLLLMITPAYELPASGRDSTSVRLRGVLGAIVDLDPVAGRLLGGLCATASSQALLGGRGHALAGHPAELGRRFLEELLPPGQFDEIFRRALSAGGVREGWMLAPWRSETGFEPSAVAWWPLQIGEERWFFVSSTPRRELLSPASQWQRSHFVLSLFLLASLMGASALVVVIKRSQLGLLRERERSKEVGERAWQSALLGQILGDIRGSMDAPSILKGAAHQAGAALGVSRCVIYLPEGHGTYRVGGEFLAGGAPALDPEAAPPFLLALIPGPALSTAVREENLDRHPRPEIQALARRLELRSCALVPVPRGEEPAAVMAFHQCDRPRSWKDSEIGFMERVGAQVGTALEQAELYAEQVRAAEVRSGLLKVAHTLSSARETRSVLELAARVAAPLAKCRRTVILVREVAREELRVGAHHGLAPEAVEKAIGLRLHPSAHPYLEEAIHSRAAVAIPSARHDWRIPPGHAQDFGLESVLVLPLIYGSEVLGLFLFEREEGRLEDSEMEVARAIAELTSSALKNAQLFEALRASESRYQDLYDNAPDMYQTLDRWGTILDCNETQRRLLGFSKGEMVGSNFERLLTQESVGAWRQSLPCIFQEGFVQDVPLQLCAKDGKKLEVFLNASVIRDAGGNVVAARAVMRDVTQVKELEHQLWQSQKLEVIGTLAGGLAHDLNNVLTGILGYGSLLRSQLHGLPGATQHVDTIVRSAVRASELTGKLLAASRRSHSPFQPVGLNKLVEETLELLARTLHKKIRIEKSLDRRVKSVLGDTTQIQQVVLNLCVNARDAMPQGGVLRIETELLEKEAKARLSVEDNGVGIEPGNLERIFEPFFTTKGAAGTGLGLSVVYGIVKAHDGEIKVRSAPGQGTRFDVFLPALLAEAETREPERREAVGGHGELVLLVDDEELLRNLGKEILVRSGYRVEVARSGEEAIEIFRKRAREISLVILDLIMPGLDGAETYQRLRDINPTVPILLSSGLSEEGAVQKLLHQGAGGFLPKPYAIGDLTAAVALALQREGKPPTVH